MFFKAENQSWFNFKWFSTMAISFIFPQRRRFEIFDQLFSFPKAIAFLFPIYKDNPIFKIYNKFLKKQVKMMISQETQGMMIEEEPIHTYYSQPSSSYPKIFLITELITADGFESLWQDLDYYTKQEDEKMCLAIEVSEQTCWEKLLEKVFKSDPQVIEKVDYVDFRGKVSFDNLVGLYKQYKAFKNKPLWPILYISLVLKPEELSQDLKRKLQDLTGNRIEVFSERDWVEGRGKSSQVRILTDTWQDEEKKEKNDIKMNWSDVLQEIDHSWDWDPRELKRGEKDVVLEGFIERLYSKDI